MTTEPKWLTVAMVLAIHDEQLAIFGGGTGLRDPGLLESALARPVNRFHYDPDCSLYELAAAYAAGLMKNHPFVDGNKRTGLLALQAFLILNGARFAPDQKDEATTILNFAAGEIGEAELAGWIRANSETR